MSRLVATRRTSSWFSMCLGSTRSSISITIPNSVSNARRPCVSSRISMSSGRQPGPTHHENGRLASRKWATASAIRRSASASDSRARQILLNVSVGKPEVDDQKIVVILNSHFRKSTLQKGHVSMEVLFHCRHNRRQPLLWNRVIHHLTV